MNKRTLNKQKAGKTTSTIGKMDYSPRNTHLDKNGNVVVRGKVKVLHDASKMLRGGSFFTRKGVKPTHTQHGIPIEQIEQIEDLNNLEAAE